MRPPKPYSCSHSVDIPWSPERTGHYLEDAEKFLGFWASPGGRTSSSTPLIAPGTVLEFPLALGPFRPSWIAVVSQFRPQEKIVLRPTQGPVDARTTVTWEPIANQHDWTRVTISVAGRPARRWSRSPGLLNTVTKSFLVATSNRLLAKATNT